VAPPVISKQFKAVGGLARALDDRRATPANAVLIHPSGRSSSFKHIRNR